MNIMTSTANIQRQLAAVDHRLNPTAHTELTLEVAETRLGYYLATGRLIPNNNIILSINNKHK